MAEELMTKQYCPVNQYIFYEQLLYLLCIKIYGVSQNPNQKYISNLPSYRVIITVQWCVHYEGQNLTGLQPSTCLHRPQPALTCLNLPQLTSICAAGLAWRIWKVERRILKEERRILKEEKEDLEGRKEDLEGRLEAILMDLLSVFLGYPVQKWEIKGQMIQSYLLKLTSSAPTTQCVGGRHLKAHCQLLHHKMEVV